jgi:hypothetical protein
MLLRYFAVDGAYDVEAPEGTCVAFRSHIQVGTATFLDDILMVPWQDRFAPIPGEIIPALARTGMYGLRLIHCPQCAEEESRAEQDAGLARACGAHRDF